MVINIAHMHIVSLDNPQVAFACYFSSTLFVLSAKIMCLVTGTLSIVSAVHMKSETIII